MHARILPGLSLVLVLDWGGGRSWRWWCGDGGLRGGGLRDWSRRLLLGLGLGQRRLLLLSGIGLRAGDGVLELTHAATQRATDLRQSLGAEHQQQNYDQEDYMEWVI